MKVVLINGSPHEEGCTYTALNEIAVTLAAEGIESEVFQIGKAAIAGCTACGYCSTHDGCAFADKATELYRRLGEFDGMVIGSPVYYAGPNGNLLSLLDRLFYMGGGEIMAGKPGAAVVSCRRSGTTASFDRLNKYFTISNMPVVPSQYWNGVHGFTPDDVRQDLEGLQTMRTLARNMAWMMKCFEAGRKAGIGFPEHEPGVATNFIG